MKLQTRLQLISFTVLAMFALIGCISPFSTIPQMPTAKAYPTFHPSQSSALIPEATTIFPATYTPIPTLLHEKEKGVADSLRSEGCILPCYLGITPGKTTLPEGRDILENLGGSYLGDYKRKTDGASLYTYTFDIGDERSNQKLIYHSVSLITNNDLIQIIDVGAGTQSPKASQKSIEMYRKYWQRYSARQIFLQIGQPDQLYTEANQSENEFGRTLVIDYERNNIVIQLYGLGIENNICPMNEAKRIFVEMSLSFSNSSLKISSNGKVPPTDREVWLPIEKVLGLDTDEFYKQVIADPSVCFEPK